MCVCLTRHALQWIRHDIKFLVYNGSVQATWYFTSYLRRYFCYICVWEFEKELKEGIEEDGPDSMKLKYWKPGWVGLHQCDIRQSGSQGRWSLLPVTCFCHNGCCLPYVKSPASLYFRQTVPQHIGHTMFWDINILQGNVVTPLSRGGICSDLVIANFLLSVTVK